MNQMTKLYNGLNYYLNFCSTIRKKVSYYHIENKRSNSHTLPKYINIKEYDILLNHFRLMSILENFVFCLGNI